MSKLKYAYTNQDLVDALKGSDDVYSSLVDEISTSDYDDEQIHMILSYKSLTRFEKDLLYLTSQRPVTEVAALYHVSKTIIYNKLHLVQKKLSQQ